jgi:hypothetical protein
MEFPINSSDHAAADQTLANERRASARVPCDLDTTCQPITGALTKSWSARVVDISRGGIGLVLNRRFETGAMLSVRLDSRDGETRTLFLRVVHLAHNVDGSWRLGCAFASELVEEELRVFKAERVRPTEPDCRAWVRFACNEETFCRAVAPGRTGTWPARVIEISPGGLRLLGPCQVEEGTTLNVKLPDAANMLPRHVLVRVVRNQSLGADKWMLACEFADQLSDEDLQRFQ